ncbi:hypothetical protein TMatcc_009239 [Talaromyces marneffei ATCC 18224]|uniref:Uncharacterized protein n=2 Tax=Talaromyces marneffei TaxID=37727 RepID=B6QN20_TALMQ|nr:conserved hypothetical protein [Talaromyces marneffei ATCC 18224]KAE8551139.1 hypothetical protein EYB25_007373 [Talaromyces marneffei]
MEARENVPLQQLSRETSTHEEHDRFADQYEVPQYEGRDDDVLPPYEQRRQERIRSTPLHREVRILIPVLLYAVMAIYSWVTICMISRVEGFIANTNSEWTVAYRSARILQVIANVATLPVISFVCAWAAAVFVQNQSDAYSLRLRQVVTLADRAWTNPMQYVRLLIYPSGFKRYGSSMLYLAIFIHIFGAITYPIQSLLLSTRQVSTVPVDRYGPGYTYSSVKSLPMVVNSGSGTTDASWILAVRQELQTLGINGYQNNLWGNTAQLRSYTSNSSWFAPLSSNTSTGLYYDQYISRVNCSAEVRNMTADEFPSNCSEDSLFYAAYAYPNSNYNLTVEVCLPGNVSQSPWLYTDARQDFTEVLYVNINSTFASSWRSQVLRSHMKPFKVIMNTTAGLFELPNIKNGQMPGPLVSNSSCTSGSRCNPSTSISRRRDHLSYDYFYPTALGPLAITALALFGSGSFAEIQQNPPQPNSISNNNKTGWKRILDDAILRDTQLPLEPLGLTDNFAYNPVDDWFGRFSEQPVEASSAFTQAGFLAIKAMYSGGQNYGGISVYSNNSKLGQITLPAISMTAIIAGSVLLGLYMIPLLGLALYAAFSRRWIDTLDAFTMLRMGAALGQKDLPLLIGKSKRKIEVLDNLPGVVRDISGPDDKVRQLALGIEGGAPLQLNKRYLAYPGNDDPRNAPKL